MPKGGILVIDRGDIDYRIQIWTARIAIVLMKSLQFRLLRWLRRARGILSRRALFGRNPFQAADLLLEEGIRLVDQSG